jgi:hypothetical protein
MNGSFTFDSKKVQANLNSIAKGLPVKMGRALTKEAGILTKESKVRTPVDTGDLRDSHEIHKPEVNGRDVEVKMEAGGGPPKSRPYPPSEYAIPVHERLVNHKIGQAKFMESVINEERPVFASHIAHFLDIEELVVL